MRARRLAPLALLALAVTATGCTPLFVAGGATAAVVASDRRTVGAFIDDENIELKASSSLAADKALAEQVHINVTSLNATVLLTGEAPTTGQRDRVLVLVRDVPGVRRTVNEIRIAEPTPTSSRTNDAWLTAKVKTKLLNTRDLESIQVKVVTENGTVYLMGLVRKSEAGIASEATRTVGGVQRVVKLFEYLD